MLSNFSCKFHVLYTLQAECCFLSSYLVLTTVNQRSQAGIIIPPPTPQGRKVVIHTTHRHWPSCSTSKEHHSKKARLGPLGGLPLGGVGGLSSLMAAIQVSVMGCGVGGSSSTSSAESQVFGVPFRFGGRGWISLGTITRSLPSTKMAPAASNREGCYQMPHTACDGASHMLPVSLRRPCWTHAHVAPYTYCRATQCFLHFHN
jgi:hypothetical protein